MLQTYRLSGQGEYNYMQISHIQYHTNFGTISVLFMSIMLVNKKMEDNKMKTTTYNPQREIITTILVMIILTIFLTAAKAQGPSSRFEGSEAGSGRNDEKAVKSAIISSTEKVTSDNSLAEKIKFWMNSGTYWDTDTEEATPARELAQTIAKWMSNGSFWSTSKKEMEREDLVLSKKDGMFCNALAADDK